MPDHHVKGQPAASTYVREKGCLKCDTIRETPCMTKFLYWHPTGLGTPRYRGHLLKFSDISELFLLIKEA